MISEASVMGVSDAQVYLAEIYSRGMGVEKVAERATRYYRLCAAAANAGCQYKLAKIQLAAPNRSERTYIQALAWLTLAAEGSYTGAKDLLATESENATTEQIGWIARLKPQLVNRQ